MNNENTLFLITGEGDHEDNPIYIWPLSKIKNYVTQEVYNQLLVTEGWVISNWFNFDILTDNKDKETLENIRVGNSTNDDFSSFLGSAILVMKMKPKGE